MIDNFRKRVSKFVREVMKYKYINFIDKQVTYQILRYEQINTTQCFK